MVGKQRNFGLDIVRAVSILLVIVAHRFKFDLELGVVGVQIFFILSGFLVGQILINDYKNGADSSVVMKFWKRRWFRTLPLYYLVLFMKIIFFGNPLGWKILVYFVFLQANFIGIDFFPVSWSLVVEEWFYLFLPMVTIIFFKKGIQPAYFLRIMGSLIILFFVARFTWNYLNKGLIIYQFDCLLLGVVLAALKIYYNKFYVRLNSTLLFLAGLAMVIILTFVLGDMSYIPTFAPFYRVTWYLLISIGIAFMIPFIELSTLFNETIKKIRPLYYFFTWTSILTYSIYLLHGDIFLIRFSENGAMNLVLQAIILCSVSFIVYALYEHPMMSLREKFSLKHYMNSIRSFSFKV